MSEFWQELRRDLGGRLAVEGTRCVLYGELPGCEFTVLGLAGQAVLLQVDYSDGEDRDTLRERLRRDDALGATLREAGLAIGRDSAYFLPEQFNCSLRPARGHRLGPAMIARVTRAIAAFLTRDAPLRDRWCQGCGQSECELSRQQGNTVRYCSQCLDLRESLARRLASLPTGNPEAGRLDLSPLGLHALSPSAQIRKGERYREQLESGSPRYWVWTMALAGLGWTLLSGPRLVLAALALLLGALALWAGVTGQWLVLTDLARELFATPVTAALLLGFLLCLMKLLTPAQPSAIPPELCLERASQPELFAWLDGLSDRMGAPRVSRVELFEPMNATAGEQRIRGRWVRTVGLGLPLLELLSRDELAAVVAHELGHLCQRDWRIRLVRRVSWTWLELVAQPGRRPDFYTHFARWYLPTFWLYARALAFSMEKDADRASTRAVPAECQALQLLRVNTFSRVQGEALRAGMDRAAAGSGPIVVDVLRTPVDELARLSDERLQEAYRETLEQEPDWLSLHPDMGQRLADLGVSPPSRLDLEMPPSVPAASMLRDFAELRATLTAEANLSCVVKVEWDRRSRRGVAARAERLAESQREQPTSAGQTLLGYLMFTLRRHEEACAFFARALELQPSHLRALAALVETRQEMGQPARVLEALGAHLPPDATDLELLSSGGRAAEQCHRPDVAANYYRRILALDLELAFRESIESRMARL